MKPVRFLAPPPILLALLFLSTLSADAQVAKSRGSALDDLAYRSERLRPSHEVALAEDLGGEIASTVANAWAAFRSAASAQAFSSDASSWVGYVSRRTGRLEYAEGAGLPWAAGAGNRLASAATGKVDLATLEQTARAFVAENSELLGVSAERLSLSPGRSGRLAAHVWAVDFDVLSDGQRIEGARVFFRINNGNLIQFGSENLPAPDAAADPKIEPREKALELAAVYLGGFEKSDQFLDAGSLHLVPVAASDGRFAQGFEPGHGLGLARVWQFIFVREGVTGTWRVRVDAATLQILEVADQNDYISAQVRGGVYADNTSGEFIWPMPYADLSATPFATNGGGIYNFSIFTPQTSTLDGTYVSIADSCGSISKGSGILGVIDFGTGSGTDCTTPGVGGSGNTHSARTQFFSVNRGKDMARGWLPGVSWLNNQLDVNTNGSAWCNAFWSTGSADLNFFQAAAPCVNLGEVPGVGLHEFGHGLDANDGTAAVDKGTGEAYGDTMAFLTTHGSCVGPGSVGSTICSGYGDACTSCTGIREVDYARHASNTAAKVNTFTKVYCPAGGGYDGPCGQEGHCESMVATEALWDFANRDLTLAGSSSAWAILERLWFGSRPTATSAFTCDSSGATWTSDGCASGTLWRTMRAIDDDDGNLANGTPHSAQMYTAFNRHGIACASDAAASVSFSGCTPPAVPTVTVTPSSYSMSLTWTNSGVGIVYDVFRNETGCNSGFAKIAEDVATTSYNDTTTSPLSNYNYQVVAHPTGNEACSAAPSACKAVTALSDTDVWSHDKPWDTGLEPDPATAGNNMWESEDIWVRNDATAGGHQDPILGQVNYVHVLWENKGSATAYNAVVRVYYAIASSGLSWPTDWTEIGAGVITTLASGGTWEISVPWVPTVSGHICLYARLDTPQDPMTYLEGSDPNYNTRYNNNIVWRNVNVIDLFAAEYVAGRMIVRNVATSALATRLTFLDRLDTGVRLAFLQRGRIVIDLGPALFNRWTAGGRLGTGIRVAGATSIEILYTPASSPYIQFQTNAREAFEIHPSFQDTAANKDRTRTDKHVFEIRQTNPGNGTIVGGVTYQIKAPYKL